MSNGDVRDLLVAEAGVSRRTRDLLAKVNISYLGELVRNTEAQLIHLGLGRKELKEIRTVISELGLHLGATDAWHPSDRAQAARGA